MVRLFDGALGPAARHHRRAAVPAHRPCGDVCVRRRQRDARRIRFHHAPAQRPVGGPDGRLRPSRGDRRPGHRCGVDPRSPPARRLRRSWGAHRRGRDHARSRSSPLGAGSGASTRRPSSPRRSCRIPPSGSRCSPDALDRPRALRRRGCGRPFLAPATDIVREGEYGDAYLIVDSGRVAVSQGAARSTSSGPAKDFGEIALLHAVPRTATVKAMVSTTIYSITCHDFHEAIAGPTSAAVADRIAAENLARARPAG